MECAKTFVRLLQNQVACAHRAKIYAATHWIAIATFWLFSGVVTGLISVTEAIGQGLCKPTLSATDAQFSPIDPETLARNWTAVVSVDTPGAKQISGELSMSCSRDLAKLPPIWNSGSRSYGYRRQSMSASNLAVMKRWSAIGLITSHRAFVGSDGETVATQPSQVMSALGQSGH